MYIVMMEAGEYDSYSETPVAASPDRAKAEAYIAKDREDYRVSLDRAYAFEKWLQLTKDSRDSKNFRNDKIEQLKLIGVPANQYDEFTIYGWQGRYGLEILEVEDL